ncbi:hypothetical protein CcCBS67573_g07038 [Chytriomyces confervae]|uniref:Uncharacterized protein n=1 Tax=Chytriomyces confervae TaxID=246404 RepID=A0A507EXP6_9FUNG|nr:hypothetical protein CcCBS67573_g07038 [Chytriomyces confervae]
MGSILKFGAKCSSTPGVPTGAFCLPTLKCIQDDCTVTGITVLQEGATCSIEVPVSALCVDGLSCYNKTVCVLKEKEATTTSAPGYYAPTTVAPAASTKNLYNSAADRTLVTSAVFGVLAAFAI